MKLSIRQLIQWKGEIDRRGYLVWGIILFAIKYNLDRSIALGFDRTWFITDYFVQADNFSINGLAENDRSFFLTLVLASLPFIWFGTVLCVKRLRSAQLPGWLVIFFFIPFINFLLFVLLGSIPERQTAPDQPNGYLARLIPKSEYGSALFAIGVVSIVCLSVTVFLVNYLHDYGWSLFVGIPFFLGFAAVLSHGYHRPLKYRQAVGVALSAIALYSLIIFIFAVEGIICIAMAFPIFFGVAFIGASIGYVIHSNQRNVATNTIVVPLFLISAMGFLEKQSDHTPSTMSVETEIVIDAGRQEVWDELVAFSEIEEPSELLFKTGIAYPTYAEINGVGVGAIRKCNFTTGSFIEPITVWDEPNLLQFGVLDQPPPMVEWSIYKNLEIEHLNGYFRSEKGQFKLEELPNGKTRLIGTTWYHHDVWPNTYWKLWSDYILHHIHTRVLTHIKKQAERVKTRRGN